MARTIAVGCDPLAPDRRCGRGGDVGDLSGAVMPVDVLLGERAETLAAQLAELRQLVVPN
jgi:hypothetical protein